MFKDSTNAKLNRIQGEKRNGMKGADINPHRRLPAHESASVPPAYRHLFGRKLPGLSSCQDVHHRLVALPYGTQLRDRHMSTSARLPIRRLSHRLP
jgi:hypothetical protein